MQALTVHLNCPDLVDELVASFRRSGCAARRVGISACTVEHTAALDDDEARVEVTFFLRAWQAGHRCAQASLAP